MRKKTHERWTVGEVTAFELLRFKQNTHIDVQSTGNLLNRFNAC